MTVAAVDPTSAAVQGDPVPVADPKPAVPAVADPVTPAAATAVVADPNIPAAPVVPLPAAPAPVVVPPVTYALTVPDGSPLSPADLAGATARATALGLSPAQAQQLVDVESANLLAAHAAFLTEAKADPEIGGAQFDATTQKAQAGMAWLFPATTAEGQAMREFLDRTGFGNHKAVLRAFARLGKALAEDAPPTGSPGVGATTTLSKAERTDAMFPSTAQK